MILFALTIFVSAFLLFMVQPLLGKVILPWFGGTPAVWTTCMLFFQVLLLGGYAYAHYSTVRFSARRQALVHAALLALAVAVTAPTIWPDAPGGSDEASAPIASILLLLTVAVGLPYFTLSATGSLVQAWFARVHPGRSPYPLYALSNAGSLLGLLGYPFVVEPLLGTHAQASGWFWGYFAFALLCGALLVVVARRSSTALAPDEGVTQPATDAPPPTRATKRRWVALGACGSIMLLAITNRMTLDIAAIPFLWVVPLSLYLLSFVLCFGSERRYPRWLFLPALVFANVTACTLMIVGVGAGFGVQVFGWSLTLLVLVMVCHGELYRLRPAPRHLTAFYLALSLGGALGGVFVGVIAPLLFTQYFELHFGLIATSLLVLDVFRQDPRLEFGGYRLRAWVTFCAVVAAAVASVLPLVVDELDTQDVLNGLPLSLAVLALVVFAVWFSRKADETGALAAHERRARAWLLPFAALAGLVVQLGLEVSWKAEAAIATSRSFFGVLSVKEYHEGGPKDAERRLLHGAIRHGAQYLAPDRQAIATTYYSPDSGVGIALSRHPERLQNAPLKVGLVGLGAGTLLAYGHEGDSFRVYEIDRDVEHMARTHFTYFDLTKANVEVVFGDGRVSLEREQSRDFDVLVLDAFSSDAIPIHLLTYEAFEIYARHLDTGGILAVHVSNRHLDLKPVVAQSAKRLGFELVFIESTGESPGAYSSDWILLSRNADLLADDLVEAASSDTRDIWFRAAELRPWTDDYANLLDVLRS